MHPHPLRRQAWRWLAQARAELAAAEHIIPIAPFVSAFLSQQAAEKGLKSVILLADRLPTHTHALVDLLHHPAVWQYPSLHPLYDDLLALSHLYMPTRYPDAVPRGIPAELYTEGDGRQATEHARRVLSAIGTVLSSLEEEGAAPTEGR